MCRHLVDVVRGEEVHDRAQHTRVDELTRGGSHHGLGGITPIHQAVDYAL